MVLSQSHFQRVAAARSLLFAPANDVRKVGKLGSLGSDAVVLDLEDAVAEEERPAARSNLAAVLPRDCPAVLCVRINGWAGDGLIDVAALPLELIDAVIVPKVETASELREIDEALAQREVSAGLERGSVAVIPLIETPRGVLAMAEICAAPPARLARFAFGSADYTAELGVPWTPNSPATTTARSLLAMHSQAAGLPAPFDGPYLHIHDLDGLREDTAESLARGFTGRVVVYPKQVAVVQEVYGGPAGDLGHLRRLTEAFEAALDTGLASIQFEGRFVDYPVYRDAKRRLAVEPV